MCTFKAFNDHPNQVYCLQSDLSHQTYKMSSNYPYKWVDISAEDQIERRKLFSPSAAVLVRSEPDGILMPKAFAAIAEELYNFELRADDIWLVTYPKCGTTWTQVKLLNLQQLLNLKFMFAKGF